MLNLHVEPFPSVISNRIFKGKVFLERNKCHYFAGKVYHIVHGVINKSSQRNATEAEMLKQATLTVYFNLPAPQTAWLAESTRTR